MSTAVYPSTPESAASLATALQLTLAARPAGPLGELTTSIDQLDQAVRVNRSRPLAELSLAELRALKTHWVELAERVDDFETIMAVAAEFAVPFQLPGYHPARCEHHRLVLEYGLVADYYFALGRRTYGLESVVVTAGPDLARPWQAGTRLCKYSRWLRTGTNQPVADGQHRFFVPGPWINQFRGRAGEARGLQIAHFQDALEADRQGLLAELAGVRYAALESVA